MRKAGIRAVPGQAGGHKAEAAVMRRLFEAFSSGLDLEKICMAVVDLVVEEVGASNCSLYLVGPGDDELVLAAARGGGDPRASFYPDGSAYRRFAMGEGVCGLAARDGRAILIDDVSGDPRFVPSMPLCGEIRSLLCVPLSAGGKVGGVINLSHTDLGAFSKANESLISLVSAQAGIAVSNVRLYTRLAQAHENLAVAEKRMREIFSRANDAMLVIDQDGRTLDANRRWEELAGLPRERWDEITVENVSRDGAEVGGFEDFTDGRRALGRFLKDNAFVREGVTLEATMVRPGGPSNIVEISSKAFPFEAREVCLVILRDVTERKRLASQLIKSEKLAAIGEVTAALAHEINNPLGALYNAVCLLKRDLHLSGDNAKLLEVTVDEAAHLSEMVNDFLSFARFPRARLEWDDINEQVSNALFLMKRDDRMERNIEVVTNLAPDLATARIDRAQFQEIVFNLISNSLDAMPQGGRLLIKTYNARIGDRPAVGLLVEDTGTGISPADLDKVFAPFFTTKSGGTGLGLAIVKRIIEDHQGTIGIDSVAGGGARVSVVVPLSREDSPWPQF